MPIPQLKKKNTSSQLWRQQRKKYYAARPTKEKKIKPTFSRPHRRQTGLKNTLLSILSNKIIIKWSVITLVGLLFVGFIYISWISRNLPSPNQLMDRQVAQSTKIYDRTGETILYEIHGDEKRTIVNLDEIPDHLKWATIAIEDKDFYEHGGFSLWAMFRTAITNVLFGKKAGGSTLTQQFIKNSVLTSEKTYTRKIKELILAYRVEKKFTKDEVLQMYFNEIPYGSTAYGVEAASQRYFGKSVRDINLAEGAILAALPQAPSRYSPYGSNLDILIDRQHYILDLMVKQGHTTEPKAEAAKQYNLEFKKRSNNITAPHFVMYVKELLSEKYGEKMIEQEGLKIYTTLDLYKQKIAEEVIEEQAEKNETNYSATNAGLISIDPKTGQILAMVGSRDYFNDDIDGQVNITTSQRQPGSSMKPLVYAATFNKGYTADTVLYDVVTNFSNNPDEPYEPHNYDNEEHGPVTIRKALAGSLNIPAVKAMYLAGAEDVLDLAENFGYTTLSDRSRFGLSLVLGGGEVKLIEHTNAYSAFAREGKISPLVTILRIEDKNGKTIEEFEENKIQNKEVLEPQTARLINNILSDNNARAYAFGEQNWLTLGDRPVGAKTGTTNDYRDAWTIGYTPSIVTGVWVGNNDNSEMKRGAAGGVVAAPIWHNYMKRVLGNTPIESFNEPYITPTDKPVLDGKIEVGEIVKIDKASNLLATEYTPDSFIEEKIYAQDHSILYYVNKDNPRGEQPKNPEKDPQFDLWETRVIEWATTNASSTILTPPTEYDNLHKPSNQPDFKIVTPTNNQTIIEPLLTAEINASAPRGVRRVEYYIDNNLVANNTSYPFSLSAQVNFLNNGFHNLKIKVCDDIDNCSEQSVEFNLILDTEPTAGRDINITWVTPTNGLSLNNIDFPFDLKMSVHNPGQTAKIDIFLANDDGRSLVSTLQPVTTEMTTGSWLLIPKSGTYKLYGQAIGWQGQRSKSNEMTIIINNINN